MDWHAEAVAVALRDATLQHASIPAARCKPAGLPSNSAFTVAPSRTDSAQLPAHAVSAIHIVLDWPSALTDELERRIVRLRADGKTWRQIGAAVGRTHKGAMFIHGRAMSRIARDLNVGRLKAPRGLLPTPLGELAA